MVRSVWCILLAFVALPAWADGDAERGFQLSQQTCGRCHAIDPKAPWNSIGSTPSFMLMAKKLDSYAERVLTVSGRRPHNGQKLAPSNEELNDILAYIKTLVP